jgi:hypothetical protein
VWRLRVGACVLGLLCAGGAACRRTSRGGAAPQAVARPTLRLLVVTDLAGMLEPCGCSRRSRGGLDRLAAALTRARAERIPSLFLLAGPTLFEPARGAAQVLPQQERWEAGATAELLHDLHADAALLAASDVALAGSELEALARRAGFPWLLGALGPSSGAFASSARRELAGLTLELVGAGFEPARAAQDADEPRRLQREVERARRSGADLVIALLSGSSDRLESALEQSGADVLLAGGELRAQPLPVRRSAHAALLNAGRQGEQLLIADLWWSGRGLPLELGRPAPDRVAGANWLATELVALERDAPRDPAITRKLESLAQKINGFNATAYARLAAAEPRGTPSYAGSQPCAACHTAAYLWWRNTAHGRAYATLQRLNKEYNLDCVSCHVTGYGQPGGASVARVEGLEGAGCESCHGAAAAHVDNPRDAPRPPRLPVSGSCHSCHDSEHSPDFEQRSYLAKLKAPGHGLAVTRR